uniref:Uncharacterized protein n=1 Tax=Trypanosoma vivax (strain Y486) TaxID=1055687 RepID=G0U8J3_TRYVY|nr:hypothetical protein TVY486_1114030 [Trypanosoma vivax Y486]
MRTGQAWAQRMSIMGRFGEFTKERGPEMSGERAPPFIVGLNLAKSSAAQCRGTLLLSMGAGADAGSDVSFGPLEGSGGKSHKAGVANDAVGTGPFLQGDGLREGPRCCAARVGHGGSLGRNCAAAEEKLYQASGRPQRSHCRLGRSAKNIRGKVEQSSALRDWQETRRKTLSHFSFSMVIVMRTSFVNDPYFCFL